MTRITGIPVGMSCAAPPRPAAGQVWLSPKGHMMVWDGTAWIQVDTPSTTGPMRWACFDHDAATIHRYAASLASPASIPRVNYEELVEFCVASFGRPTSYLGIGRWQSDGDRVGDRFTEVVFEFRFEADRLMFYMRFSDVEVA